MNIAADWASCIGVEFSTTKTVAMLFTRKRKKSYQSQGRLKLEGKPLPWVKEAKYLGVTIEENLSWQPHITAKIKKAKKTLMAAKSSISKSWGPSPDCARWLWTGVVRPGKLYGSFVWSRARLQRLALSQIAHVRPVTPSAALEICYGVVPLDLQVAYTAQAAAIRVKPDTSDLPPAKKKGRTEHARHLESHFLTGL
jgi:hypothetical protein